jgi:hypothetical protein
VSTGVVQVRESNTAKSGGQHGVKIAARPMNLFAPIILLSAFLLFQTELIVAKYILPWFGGTPAVWNTCMLFYQSVLMLGYLYSHGLCSRVDSRTQARVHLRTLFVVLATLAITVAFWGSPLTPAARWKYFLPETPVLHILLLLAMAVGVPFFLLSTTGPLLQHWFARSYPGRSPYRLYAISNLGSLLGLLGYPFLLEWLLPIRKQAWLWTALFTAFLGLYALQTRAVAGRDDSTQDDDPAEPRRPIRSGQSMQWIGLSTCASVMLLATTNLICQNLSSSPFLWVVPLCIYLLTFTICFESSRWYQRAVFFPLYFLSVGLITRLAMYPESEVDAIRQMTAYCLLLFSVCMVCNGELERRKPPASQATPFYLSIGFGGALGGAFVVLAAPRLFHGFYEFHLAVAAAGLVILQAAWSSLPRAESGRLNFRWNLSLAGSAAAGFAALGALVMVFFLLRMNLVEQARDIVHVRNFFGEKRVFDKDGIRYLHHGAITHGGQYLAASVQSQPMLYYSPHTGIGMLLTNYRRISGRSESEPLRLGVIGLGSCGLAPYAAPGDTMRFYEIDPQVIQLSSGSHPAFTFMQGSRGRIETVLGDARLNLEAEAARHDLQHFDVLIVDAFGGDAIPVHLLTSEAMGLYLEHLRGPDSVIAVHISNRVLDLTPVLRALAARWQSTFNHFGSIGGINWVLLSRNPKILQDPALYRPFHFSDAPVLWTDDYSNLLSVLKK